MRLQTVKREEPLAGRRRAVPRAVATAAAVTRATVLQEVAVPLREPEQRRRQAVVLPHRPSFLMPTRLRRGRQIFLKGTSATPTAHPRIHQSFATYYTPHATSRR